MASSLIDIDDYDPFYGLRTIQYEFLYLCSLGVAFFLSIPIPSLPVGNFKRSLYSTTCGAMVVIWFSGRFFYHFLIISIVSYTIAHSLYKYRISGITVFVFSFAYVGLLRHLVSMNILELVEPADTCYLMLVFKLVHYSYLLENSQESKIPNTEFINFIHYLFFLPGVWSGPFLNYNMVYNCLNNPDTHKCHYAHYAIKKTISILPYYLLFKIIPMYLKHEDLLTPSFGELPYHWKLFLVYLVMIQYRCRLISGWYIAEMSCIVSGVAYNPKFPNNIDEAPVLTVDTWNLTFSTSIKTVGRAWNCTVQLWLVECVYKKLNFQKLVVLMVSGYWHGVETGYIVAFLAFGIVQAAQDLFWMKKWPYEEHRYIAAFYKGLKWFITQLLLNFCTVPFVYRLSYWKLWKELHFIGIYICIIFLNLHCLTLLFQFYTNKGLPKGKKNKLQ